MQHLFMIKILSKVGIEGNFLDLIKTIYTNPKSNFTLNDNGDKFTL